MSVCLRSLRRPSMVRLGCLLVALCTSVAGGAAHSAFARPGAEACARLSRRCGACSRQSRARRPDAALSARRLAGGLLATACSCEQPVGRGRESERQDEEAIWRRQEWGNRYRVDVSFDGSYFAGWQTWENSVAQNRTAHHHVQRALRTVLRASSLRLVSAGRTDSGVHVLSMPCHFDLPLDDTLDEVFLQSAMVRCNRLLPPALRINQLRRAAPQWHSVNLAPLMVMDAFSCMQSINH